MIEKVRTRFAPSPTGTLHIGGARTALYNYLLAKRQGGTFILRIEDTDRERSTDEAIGAILDGMDWLGFKADEGPYFQTKRFAFYFEHIDRLVQENKAYPCFCKAEDLEAKRQAAQKSGLKYRYDRTCWHLSEKQRQEKTKQGVPHCIRFYSTNEGQVVVDDLIKGRVTVAADELDDLIIKRSDGAPTYNLTVVVDDALMQITHVIRGDDHLNNAFRQVQLYEALGYSLPRFAHVSMILGADGKKLSKRHGATSVMAYRDMGYLPQAIRNYLVRLGWSHGDQEIFSLEEMIQNFSIEKVSSSAAIFNTEKLNWLSGHYIRESKPKTLVPLVKEFLEKKGAQKIEDTLLEKCVTLCRDKAKTLKDMADYMDFIFVKMPEDKEVIAKVIDEKSQPILKRVFEELEKATDFPESLKQIFQNIMKEFDVGMGKVAGPVRVALSGRQVSPGAFDLLEIFGKEKSLEKIKKYLKTEAL